MDNYNTPNDVFYIRNHLPVPDINADEYRLQIVAEGVEPISFSIEELKKHFPLYKVDATIQCGGNRRGEMIKIKPVKGLNWGVSAIGYLFYYRFLIVLEMQNGQVYYLATY